MRYTQKLSKIKNKNKPDSRDLINFDYLCMPVYENNNNHE